METKQHVLTPRQQVDRIIENLEYLLNNLPIADKQFSENRLKNCIHSLNGLLRVTEKIEDVSHASALKYKICKELQFLFMYCNLTDNDNIDSRTKLIVVNVLNDISLIGFSMNNQYYVGQNIINTQEIPTDKKFIVVKANLDFSDKPNITGRLYDKELLKKAFNEFIDKQPKDQKWNLENFVHDEKRNAIVGEFHLNLSEQDTEKSFIIYYKNEVGVKVFKVISAVDEDTARSEFNKFFPFLTIVSVELFDDWCSNISEKNSKI